MTTRNFRSGYYGTLGVSGIDEKKKLEKLLLDEKIDLELLKRICLQFHTPSMHRPLVWKLLLDVLPVYRDIHETVTEQHSSRYLALKQVLVVTKRAHLLLPDLHQQIYQLEKGNLFLTSSKDDSISSIVRTLHDIFPDELDSYLIFSKFVLKCDVIRENLSQLENIMFKRLEVESPNLYARLVEFSIISVLPTKRWLLQCFADTLPLASLERVWDKMLAGSISVLSFIGAGIVMTCIRSAIDLSNHELLLKTLSRLGDDQAERAVSKGLELWIQCGRPLQV
ncbi:TBC1 domain family member 7-like isoform X2 [Oscarella lobularis]|uniref:TBC1 domain family member 7-like isoform X2 n=1 Tax=Oscarella lobularis TaxID=121494 RepID=UPI003313150E